MSNQELPRNIRDAITEAGWLRAKAALGKKLSLKDEFIVDLDDYAHTLAAKVAASKGLLEALEGLLKAVEGAAGGHLAADVLEGKVVSLARAALSKARGNV